MSYRAVVVRAMIASPSDVPEARDAVERAIHSWNDANARARAVIIQPWRWEASAIPVLGGHPQQLINAQGVDDSDVVFALFGGRLGSPTPDAVSGTVEEIDRALSVGKPVHLYFSTAALPHDVDTRQLEAVREFKHEMSSRGLLGEFANPEQLIHEIWKAIEHDIAQLAGDDAGRQVQAAVGVDFLVQPGQQREMTGFSASGAPHYTTRHWVDVTNVGDRDAENVTFAAASESSGLIVPNASRPTVIHRGQSRRVNVMFTWGGADARVLHVEWVEDGEPRSRNFHVG